MEYILDNFQKEYNLAVSKRIYESKRGRSVTNPILFVFLGDNVREAYEYIEHAIVQQWDNGKGIAFINIITDNMEDRDNSFNFQFKIDFNHKKCLRKNVREKFYSDNKSLQCLNNEITMARDKILSSGNLFDSFDNVSISVITASNDPLNIIVSEITLLIKKRMLEVFKIARIDLYTLIKEKDVEDEFYSKAVSVAFFREIEYMQSHNFEFDKKIDVYGENKELSVSFTGNVFYMTYVLEEKNEKGMIPKHSMFNNYDIIIYINLIKNKSINIETYTNTENQYYDNVRFKANIATDNSINRYVTAGFSKVSRPNDIISIEVVKAFYERIMENLKEFSVKSIEFMTQALKIDELSINSKVDAVLPENVSIMDMSGIMMCPISIPEKYTLKQIEQKLYNERCENFFKENFIEYSKNILNGIDFCGQIKTLINECVVYNTKLGLYCALNWTEEQGEVIRYLRDKINFIDIAVNNIKNEIDKLYESKFIKGFNFKKFLVKNTILKEAKNKIFKDIYERKLEILKLNISKNILRQYENILLEIHQEVLRQVREFACIGEIIDKYKNKIIKSEYGYTAQNVEVYYKNVVNSILDNLEKKYGEAFYFEDNCIGNISRILSLERGKEKILEKIISFCDKYVLTEEEFNQSFEEEFNNRVNINLSDYDLKILTKDELYRKLCNILEYNSALKIYIMNYDVKIYQEKYFLGDYSSDFIKYAFHFDRKTRNYKIGYIHEIGSSGIEKLNLMGGFGAKDIIYIKSAVEFYNYCLENGYLLHDVDIKVLPCIF